MKFKLTVFCLLFIALAYSCRQAANQQSTKNNIKRSTSKTLDFNKENEDTLTVNKPSAIAIMLDTPELEKRRKKYGNEAFETGADDAVFYSHIVDSVLKAKNLPTIRPLSYRYLKFVRNNGSVMLIKIDTLSQIYSLFRFDPWKAPYNVDVTAVEEECNSFISNTIK